MNSSTLNSTFNSHPRYDGWKNGHMGPEMLTWRGINNALSGKGTCDYLVAQLDFREYLFAKVVPSLDWVSEDYY